MNFIQANQSHLKSIIQQKWRKILLNFSSFSIFRWDEQRKWNEKNFSLEAIKNEGKKERKTLKMEFVLFSSIMANVLLLLDPFCSSSSWCSLLMYFLLLFSIHLCNVHFVAIHHKTGIIKWCLYILNVGWEFVRLCMFCVVFFSSFVDSFLTVPSSLLMYNHRT